MRIIHLLPALTKGGGERVAVDLANQAAAAGHEVTVVAAMAVDPSMLRDALRSDVEVRYVTSGAGGTARRYIGSLSWPFRNWTWLRGRDVVHCHLTYGSVIGALIWMLRGLTRSRRPVIVETYHAVGMSISSTHRWIHSRLSSTRDALVLMAEDDFWNEFVVRRPRLLSRTIANGVAVPAGPAPAADALAYRKAIGLPEDCRWVIGTVGQLRPDRRPDLYIPIFARIARALGPGAHFVVAGEGPERERLEALVGEHRLEGRVHLPGLVPSARVPSSIMDLYLTLNVGPITGIAALEAVFAGAPVIAVQMRDDYQCGPTDWIWSSRDLSEVADHAVALLKVPERLRAVAEKQQVHVKANHTVDVMAKAYAAVYESALERAPIHTSPVR